MELHEIYETLLLRGMPEHPRLRARYDGHALIWVIEGDSGERLELATFGVDAINDARDLLTMHALRWLKTLPGMRGGCQRWQEGWNVFLDDDYWPGKPNDPRVYKFTADDPLDAILAATEHLEPTKRAGDV